MEVVYVSLGCGCRPVTELTRRHRHERGQGHQQVVAWVRVGVRRSHQGIRSRARASRSIGLAGWSSAPVRGEMKAICLLTSKERHIP